MGDVCLYETGFQCEYRERGDEQQDDAYRSDLLRAFRLQEWDGDRISGTLDRLFARLKGMPGVDALLRRLRERYPQMSCVSTDDRTMFQLLFSFDLFDKTHATICDMLERGEMSKGGIESLSENIG